MGKIVRINENTFNRLFLNEDRINLQLINGYFYPTDAVSKEILVNGYNLERIPKDAFDRWSPKLVRDGHKLAIANYNPEPRKDIEPPIGIKIGGTPKSVKNPCLKCRMGGLCDSDDCGKKNFRLFTK